MSLSKYQSARDTRRMAKTLVGRFRGGKLAPVMATAVRPSESGMFSQTITLELDPIAGRMITPITAQLINVFVPVQAIDHIKTPLAAFAGMTEVIREKLLSGAPLFGLEDETEISKRLGVNPRSIGGVKKVCEISRLAYNAANNYLRVRIYHKATKLLHNNMAVAPALLSSTALDRLNGVLDPDDRINGSVDLELPDMQLPVLGLGVDATAVPLTTPVVNVEENSRDVNYTAYYRSSSGAPIYMQSSPGGTPFVKAVFSGASAGNVSLLDFYNAQNRDTLIREMDQIIRNNPEYGPEMVMRWVHGLNVDTGKTPFVISEDEQIFGRNIIGATDTEGVEGDVMRSDMLLRMNVTVPIPKTELGGVIITLACVKPDEALLSQPDPILSDVWGVDNFVADELALDPVPVTVRDLYSDCAAAAESTVAMYTGLNELKRAYVTYGLNRHVNPATVDNKTAIWQYQVPLSVTPDSILYPTTLSHYPFADQNAEVCSYTVATSISMDTPMQFGPTPIENISVVDTENLFGEE